MLGSNRGNEARKCLDRGKALVTGASAAVSFFFEAGEEGTEHFDVEGGDNLEHIGGATSLLGGVVEEQLEAVAIGQHGVTAGVTLDGQVCFEKVLDE